ncbi:THxN family PEP-CTERM protein [bacterium]|nr:THxN family PEP-CTERM protein [bacterium]
MNKKLRFLLISLIAGLLLSFFPINQVEAQTPNYELSSVAGVWTATDGGSYVSGLNTSEVRWGERTRYWDYDHWVWNEQSGLRFEGSEDVVFTGEDDFILGELTHMNFPVSSGTAADGATLRITLSFQHPSISPDPTFTFDFDIFETSNSGSCDYWFQFSDTKCDDLITFPSEYGLESFTIGDKYYTLKIEGFEDESGNTVDYFSTEEKRENSAYLVASLSSVLVEEPDIALTKKTNDVNVESQPGPNLIVGEGVTWQYIVQNTGNVNLTNVQVNDDKVGAITCPKTALTPGESMTCTASGTVEGGQYHNTATVTADHSDGTVDASDESWYFGVEAGIDVEKYILNGSTWEDADTSGSGPTLVNGTDPVYKFVVTNSGDVTLTDVELTDNLISSLWGDQAGTTTCEEPDPFNPDDEFTCYGSLAWASGERANTATVTGDYDGDDVQDTDQAHYFGADPKINVKKEVWDGNNWVDANSVTGPILFSGNDVEFRFTVTNTGNVDLNDVSLSDNHIASFDTDRVVASCNDVASLAADDSFTCFGSLSWEEGQHVNEASVVGYYGGAPYDDTDLAHYFGAILDVDIEKSVWDGTDWQDADDPTGPGLNSDEDPLFQIVVKNTGNLPLSHIDIVDNKISDLYSDETLETDCSTNISLGPNETLTCYGGLDWAAGQHTNTAQVAAEYNNIFVNDRDSANYFGASPSIDVEKEIWDGSAWVDADNEQGPSIADGGSAILFRFIVENTGNVDLSGVTLTDDTLLTLSAGQALTTTCEEPDPFTPDDTFTCYGSLAWAKGQHENKATVEGLYDGTSYDDSDQAHYFGIEPAIEVTKEIWNGSAWVDAESITGPILWSSPSFRFTVENTGNVVLTDVHLEDSDIEDLFLDEAETTPCEDVGQLNPSGSYTCYGSLPWAAGQHENTATVTASFGDDEVDDTDQAHYFGPNLDIDVEKRVWNGSGWVDADSGTGPVLGSDEDPLFRFVVTNTGNMALSGITLQDNVINELHGNQALDTDCVPSDPLGTGDSFTCYGGLPWAAGQHENTATATGNYDGHSTDDTDPARYYGATTTVDVEKFVWDGTSWLDADSVPGPTLPSGSDVKFKFEVENTSNIALSNVDLDDSLISQLFADEGLTNGCVEPEPFNAGATFTCYGSLPWASGQHENEATISGDVDGIEAEDSDMAHYFGASPDISLTKTADPEVYTQTGEIITYEFVIENTGNVTLKDVTLSDPLAGLSSLNCSTPLPATLAVGGTITCEATYQVGQDDIDDGQIENSATASGADDFGQTVDDDDDALVEGPKQGGSIALEKTADPEIYVAVGDQITYTFTATNNGLFSLSNVTIEDPLPGLSALSCSDTLPTSLQPGDSVTCEATYTITQDDIDNGLVENTAVATGTGSNQEVVEDDDGAVVEGPKQEASIHLDKSTEPATYNAVGDEIVYSFVVTNNGIYTLYDVTVTDPLFSLNYGPIDSLEPGESKTYKYTYTITQADLDAKYIQNVATAMGYDPEENPVSSTDEALVERPEPKKVESLPTTGFAPNQITSLPPQSLDKSYTAYSDFWLEIPSLGVSVDILGVPKSNYGWDVTWLDDAAGWLEGTAYPTWPGNSVVTAHVWDAFDKAGPFVDLNKLQWGDEVIVHLNGASHVFEVRSKHTVRPDDMSLVEREEEYAWLNLLTCRGFDEESNLYQYRLIVRAVLVDVD